MMKKLYYIACILSASIGHNAQAMIPPLHHTCSEPLINTKAIDYTQDMNSCDPFCMTPLHLICANTHPSLKIIANMVKKGANLNALDAWGETPLHAICKNENQTFDIIQYLISKNANLNIANSENKTPLSLLLKSRRKASQDLKNYINITDNSIEKEKAITRLKNIPFKTILYMVSNGAKVDQTIIQEAQEDDYVVRLYLQFAYNTRYSEDEQLENMALFLLESEFKEELLKQLIFFLLQEDIFNLAYKKNKQIDPTSTFLYQLLELDKTRKDNKKIALIKKYMCKILSIDSANSTFRTDFYSWIKKILNKAIKSKQNDTAVLKRALARIQKLNSTKKQKTGKRKRKEEEIKEQEKSVRRESKRRKKK